MSPYENPYAAPPRLPIDSGDAAKVGEGISFLRHTGLVTCAGVMLSLYGAGRLFSALYGFIVYRQMLSIGMPMPTYIIVRSLQAFVLGGLFFHTAYRVWKYRRANRELSLGLITWSQWQRPYRSMWIATNVLLIGIIVLGLGTELAMTLLRAYYL